ncbi:MAG: sirohydrochlorin nickelochelatase [Methanomassiliicoccales archaeon]|nr:sirohydrochlorin nickelochelatase [Methanomassiliicoccales archaeon]
MSNGVLVVGHGSKMEHNMDLAVKMASLLEERGEFGPVEAAFMQLNAPDIPTGLQNVVRRGAEVVYVVPCFLAVGIHTTEDIPGVLGFAKGQRRGKVAVDGKDVEVRYCQPMGQDPRLADILMDRIRAEM